MISKDKIFSLFENNEDNLTVVHEDFMDNIYVKIGMFNKILKNNEIFLLKLINFYKANNIPYNEENIYNYSKFVTFNRAFFYINYLDIDNTTHVDALMCYDSVLLLKNLNLLLPFFEEKEEYEKCAHLFKIITFIESLEK